MGMGKKMLPEQIVRILRDAEVELAQGKTLAEVCKGHGVSTKSFYRWRQEYGGLRVDQAKKMKDLEKENARLKRLVADMALDNAVLKDIASGKY